MKEIYAEELMVLSSIQLFGVNPEHIKPELFGTGFILNHRDNFYFVSVFHNIKYRNLAICLETNLPPENGTVPLVPAYNRLYKISKYLSCFDILQIIYLHYQKVKHFTLSSFILSSTNRITG